jgi:hypothetical protein
MYILIFWITFYGNHVSTSSTVTLDSKEQCIAALEYLQTTGDANIVVSGTCVKR